MILLENIIMGSNNTINFIYGIGVRKDLIGKLVQCQRGPATVLGSELKVCHWNVYSGKAERAMN